MDKIITLNAFILYGIAILGIVSHAVKKWAMREIDYSVYAYFFTVDPRSTLVTVGTVLGTVIAAIGSGQIASPHIFADASVAFLAGYSFDSAIYPANSKGK